MSKLLINCKTPSEDKDQLQMSWKISMELLYCYFKLVFFIESSSEKRDRKIIEALSYFTLILNKYIQKIFRFINQRMMKTIVLMSKEFKTIWVVMFGLSFSIFGKILRKKAIFR